MSRVCPGVWERMDALNKTLIRSFDGMTAQHYYKVVVTGISSCQGFYWQGPFTLLGLFAMMQKG
ncbi:hypothetical protein KSD_75650 [Ktedonobacter sp. SOSP1-85]|nr:hypothetical protein KSD_75650 [Ktedonobacter sp. SOSP1-85]